MHALRVDYTISGPSLTNCGPVIAQRRVSVMPHRSHHITTAQLERALVREVSADMRQVLREERKRRSAKSK